MAVELTIDGARLADQQVEQYQRDGYVIVHQQAFPSEMLARLTAIFEENLAQYGEAGLDMMHMRDPRLLEFLLSAPVLNLIEPVVGPNIGLWASHFISKPPRIGKATPWHEDSSYWNGRISTMASICTVWLAIDEATPENGCMKVIPGTQAGGFSEYESVDTAANIFPSQIKPENIDESKAVYFALKPGECSLHEGRLIHGADANTSDKRRAGYTMRYFPTSSIIYPERNPGHKIWLARGHDLAGNCYENA